MDLSTHEWLWSGTVTGFLSALGLIVVAVAFGALVVRGWGTPSDGPPR